MQCAECGSEDREGVKFCEDGLALLQRGDAARA